MQASSMKKVVNFLLVAVLLLSCNIWHTNSNAKTYVQKRYHIKAGTRQDISSFFISKDKKVRITTTEWKQKAMGLVNGKIKSVKDPYNKACDNAFDKIRKKWLHSLNVNCWSQYDKKGYLSGIESIFVYDAKGKIRKTFKYKDVFEKGFEIYSISSWKKNRLIISVFFPSKGTRIYQINSKTGKVLKKYSGYWQSSAKINKKYMYVTSSSSFKKEERLVKLNIKTGKQVDAIGLQQVRNLAADEDADKISTINGGCTYRDIPVSIAADKNKCYVKTYYGIYAWNEKADKFVKLIDRESGFTVGKEVVVSMIVNKGKIYLLDTDYFNLFVYKSV